MSALSDSIVNTGKTFLGPVAEIFLKKQAKNHLKVELADLTSAQLREFAIHVQNEAAKVMSPEKAADLSKKIAAL